MPRVPAEPKPKFGLKQELIDFGLGMIGFTDAKNCFTKGDVRACVGTLIQFIPWGKVFELGKAIYKLADEFLAFTKRLRAWEKKAQEIDDGVDLYRAVGPDELADIEATGVFKAGRNSLEGKWFAESRDDAARWGAGRSASDFDLDVLVAGDERMVQAGLLDVGRRAGEPGRGRSHRPPRILDARPWA